MDIMASGFSEGLKNGKIEGLFDGIHWYQKM